MIKFKNIPSNELEEIINRLDAKLSYVNNEFGITINSYPNILRVALNAVQEETLMDLIERLSINRELERELDNVGGYTLEYLEDNNPKAELLNLLNYLKESLPKQDILLNYIKNISTRTFVVFDNNDLDFASKNIKNRKVKIISYSELKKTDT